ncbi:pentapeptide repeat-containing protein [Nocardia paucivorans]|uniref:pentapeptide repeat-containing protein n=1 Tax=Nocardia paucivorans TaxID=114259 RepID=UPI0002E01DD4
MGADLYTAWPANAELRGADLSRADLREVRGRGCRARYVSFRGADLWRADLHEVASDVVGSCSCLDLLTRNDRWLSVLIRVRVRHTAARTCRSSPWSGTHPAGRATPSDRATAHVRVVVSVFGRRDTSGMGRGYRLPQSSLCRVERSVGCFFPVGVGCRPMLDGVVPRAAAMNNAAATGGGDR